MSAQTYRMIEEILIKASMERGKIHWAKIFAHCREYIGANEKHEIKQIADKWGVEIIGK